jgi:hypothetical protein
MVTRAKNGAAGKKTGPERARKATGGKHTGSKKLPAKTAPGIARSTPAKVTRARMTKVKVTKAKVMKAKVMKAKVMKAKVMKGRSNKAKVMKARVTKTAAKPKKAEKPKIADKEILGYVDSEIRMGFSPLGEIEESASDYFENNTQAFRSKISASFGRALATFVKEQTKWPRVTDCDRLDQAFAALEKKGIVARQDFTCCQTCGHAEIGEEIDGYEKKSGRKARGYTFFHHQDTERVVEDGTLYLAYGAMEEDDAGTIEVGREIKKALVDAGFQVDWNDDVRTRILLKMDWKKRRSL